MRTTVAPMRLIAFDKLLQRFRRQKTVAKVVMLGCALTALVSAATGLGMLDEFEQYLTDKRVRWCQVGRPPPSKDILHLEIDDAALEVIGKWPWPRRTIADVLGVLNEAEPSAVALDIIFGDKEEGTDGDARLAATLAAGKYVLGYTLAEKEFYDTGPLGVRVQEVLEGNPLADVQYVAKKLDASPLDVRPLIPDARMAVVQRKVARQFKEGLGPKDEVEIRRRIFGPEATATSAGGELVRMAIAVDAAQMALLKFAAPLPPKAVGDALYSAPLKEVPRPEFARAAKSAGFVTYFATGQGVVQAEPIVMSQSGRLVPSLGVALACAASDVPLERLRLTDTDLVIPFPHGEVKVPVRSEYFDTIGHRVSGVMDLTWPSSSRWETLYDPSGKTTAQQISLSVLGDVLEARRRSAINEAALADLIQEQPKPTDPPGTIIRLAEEKLATEKSFVDGMREALKARPESQWTEEDRESKRMVDANDNVAATITKLNQINSAMNAKLSEIKRLLRGKAVVVGWNATGRTDMVPTSLEARCPGMMIHGTIFNAITTGNMVTTLPIWVTLLAVLVMGGLTTIAVSGFSPWAGQVRAGALVIAYSLINGYILFGYLRTVIGIAGPITVVPVVWGGCTVMRFIFERIDRRRIQDRFSTRVDPQLVQYVMENPERIRFDGEERVMTVVFTDLAGFTTISEKLGPATVPLLNEYFQLMVPIIRRHKGYVNKFLGDGMMFFFNGVYAHPEHTRDAIATVLEMQQALVTFNESLKARGLPEVTMRVGITTGPMVVGDAGSDGASDYTALGDNVNLAARLESANKATGTLVLVNDEAAAALGGEYLLRPVGSLQVVGKSRGVMTYEVICLEAHATEAHRLLVSLTAAIVEAYRAGDWAGCEAAIAAMEAHSGPSKFTKLYHHAIATQRLAVQIAVGEKAAVSEFTGTIELTEK